jgi:hypothetical protein
MFMHELRADADKLVINSHGQLFVLSSSGAVFRNFFTDDLRNVCIAFARLFDDDWRNATDTEYTAWLAKPQKEQMLRIEWNDAPPPEPRLKLVEGNEIRTDK